MLSFFDPLTVQGALLGVDLAALVGYERGGGTRSLTAGTGGWFG